MSKIPITTFRNWKNHAVIDSDVSSMYPGTFSVIRDMWGLWKTTKFWIPKRVKTVAGQKQWVWIKPVLARQHIVTREWQVGTVFDVLASPDGIKTKS